MYELDTKAVITIFLTLAIVFGGGGYGVYKLAQFQQAQSEADPMEGPELCEVTDGIRPDGTITYQSTKSGETMFVLATVNGPKMFVECDE